MKHFTKFALAVALLLAAPAHAQTQTGFSPSVESSIQTVLPRMITWRRDFHQNPELSYEEVRTARVVAAHLRSLRLEVRTGVAQTGVVGVLRGGRPGPVIALRADMDALPVTEEGDLPFRSRARGHD
ncbi:MAG: amidohydrolase, partial [Alphaproteobacteria bacterium]